MVLSVLDTVLVLLGDVMTKETLKRGITYFIGICLQPQRASPLSSRWESDRYGARAVAESFASCLTGIKQRDTGPCVNF